MRTTHVVTLVFTLLVAASWARAENPADFTVESALDSSKFQLSQHRGKIIALHFLLKTECPFCLRHTHDYDALAAKTPNVVHIFLKPDSAAEIKAWAGKISKDGLKGLPKVYRDPDAKLATEFGIPDGYKFHGQVVHFPALVVLDGKGQELFRYVGKSNSDRTPTADFTAKLAAITSKP
jgi:peroxiredoxin Q/BCP